MHYAEVRALFFVDPPTDLAVPAAVSRAAPARRLRDAFEPIAMHHVWSEAVNTALAAAGLDFFGGYVTGRAAVLGDVQPAVAASAFAVFEPGRISTALGAGRTVAGPADVLAILDRTAPASLQEALRAAPTPPDEAAIDAIAEVLTGAVEQADGTGRPLFSGVRALPRPPSAAGRLWRACHGLREHRGDSHVAAFVAAGFEPVEMNILTELWLGYPLGAYSASRAWGPERTEAALRRLQADRLLDGERLTDAGSAVRDAVEAATDRAQRSVIDAIGDRLEEVIAALESWSAACVAAGAFPPDPRKRYAG
jgi:hypothetical protein